MSNGLVVGKEPWLVRIIPKSVFDFTVAVVFAGNDDEDDDDDDDDDIIIVVESP